MLISLSQVSAVHSRAQLDTTSRTVAAAQEDVSVVTGIVGDYVVVKP